MTLLDRAGPFARGQAAAVVAGAAGFAVFAATLTYGFVYDDQGQILSNPWIWDARYLPNLLTQSVHSYLDERPWNYYRPIQMLIYFIDAQVFGRNPFGFHLTNVLIHSVATAAGFLLLKRFTGARRALFAALLFAIHPAHVESVAWISGSTDVNCAVLIFLCLLAWWAAREEVERGWKAIGRYSFVGLLFLLALLAKETAIVTPILALALPATSLGFCKPSSASAF